MTLVLSGIAVAAFLLFRTGFRSTRFEWKLTATLLLLVIVLAGFSSAMHMGGGGDAFVSLTAVVLGLFALVYTGLLSGQMIRWLSGDRDQTIVDTSTRSDSTIRWLCMYMLLFSGPAIASLLVVASATGYQPVLETSPADSEPQLLLSGLPEPSLPVAGLPDRTPARSVTVEIADTDLHGLAAAGLHDRVKAILARGIDVNARDPHGMTPLMTAADAGEWRAAGLLMMFGALRDLQDDTGRTALMYAIENDMIEERHKGKTAENHAALRSGGRALPG